MIIDFEFLKQFSLMYDPKTRRIKESNDIHSTLIRLRFNFLNVNIYEKSKDLPFLRWIVIPTLKAPHPTRPILKPFPRELTL